MSKRPECSEAEVVAWFAGQLQDDWFIEPVEVIIDRDEILVTGRLPEPASVPDGENTAEIAADSRISAFRVDTRDTRIKIARAAQTSWLRSVSWAAQCADLERRFTTKSVPVMSRLHLDQRKTLDTLVETGVARSRSDALGWCVQQVQEHQADWISELEDAMKTVEKIRSKGPA